MKGKEGKPEGENQGSEPEKPNTEADNEQQSDTDSDASEAADTAENGSESASGEAQDGDDSGSADGSDSGQEGEQNGDGDGDASLSEEERYQEALKQAAESGKPVVVIFGSQDAMDTQKLTEDTLKQNFENDQAVFMYADTDNLDPNSDLGKVARRSEEQGLGLGPDGKPNGTDMVFTGIYKVQQNEDGSYSLGKSTATFWGGRESISKTMQEQMKYARGKAPDGPTDGPGPQDNPSRPSVDGDNEPRREDGDDGGDDTPADANDERRDDRDEDLEDSERKRREQEERERLDKLAQEKKFDGSDHDDALRIAAETGRDVVMKFGAEWCGPCRAMNKNTWSDSNVSGEMKENDVFVNVDGDKHQDLAQQYNVSSYPTTLIGQVSRGEDGNYQFTPSQRIEGYVGPEDMLSYLRN